AFRGRRHAAEGDARAGDRAVLDGEVETGSDRGDVLVPAFGYLVGRVEASGLRARHGDRLDEFAGCAVLLAVGDEELLERDLAPRLALAERDAGPEGDQRRRRVADGRTVGDVAADGTGIAHLPAADPQPVVAQMRKGLGQRRFEVG